VLTWPRYITNGINLIEVRHPQLSNSDIQWMVHRSIPMVSCMLLSHESQAVQTSRFSAARVPMDTCRMSYIKRFWKCSL